MVPGKNLTPIFLLLTNLFLRENTQRINTQIKQLTQLSQFQLIPSDALLLLSAAEDRRFFLHKGFDPKGILRAIRNYLLHSKIEGASTIEQQLVRVLSGRYERTFTRKIREIMLATYVSRNFPKSTIAKSYLCVGYYGWRMNGLQQACARHTWEINKMDETEFANLIARLKYPEPKNMPDQVREKILKRAKHIILVKNKYF